MLPDYPKYRTSFRATPKDGEAYTCIIYGRTIDEIKANAALMTQSPVMYKSLEEDMKFLRSTAEWLANHRGMKNTLLVAAMFNRADEIEKLLSKARGEE